ncbi:PhzF family phenazine biosynthesis protein [Streptomyces alkaliterrae]|uniref:PhzF family phenazine biosynthesis isomerase n=1 Tax=Streptomyces alkaliterrae TaxID=2213162 RepID=A0A5P0YLG1_9ACTN|nr:PhzF family phenazine biosynthesis protein [Streptomyces alkaliterrae]MBB1257374.1 PhzF family phenazine biosynthesis protein [Streptomyces alkaliterrae]MQS00730.1 PhzF family phenazine biosynthesis isomerase [Streptomyces alkaliterrae]
MRIRYVDAFTDRPFAGNPAAVVLLDGGGFPPDDALQRLAAEVNLSETAFAHRLPGHAEADWALRWFTPTTEVRLCGHATLATAHVLRTATGRSGPVRFATLSGVLGAEARDDGSVVLDFPTAPLRPAELPEAARAALGTPVLSVHHTGENVGDLLVEVTDEACVRALDPDLGQLARLRGRGVIVTARAAEDAAGHDYVSRCFFPAVGIAEDPVTGSAHTALAPFWSQRLGRNSLTGLQASARTGLVRTEVRGDRTLLRGSAVTVIEGDLLVPLAG